MRLRVGDRAPDVLLEAIDGTRLECNRSSTPAVILFTRYAECPVCQLHVAHVATAIPAFRARSCGVWMVFQSTPEHLRAAMAEWKAGFSAVADPTAHLYDVFAVETSVVGYLAPRSLLALVRAMLAGKRHGRFEGRETQMPAAFVLDPSGRIAFAYYGRSIGDDAPISALLAAIDSTNDNAQARATPAP
jgi:peroxiredoxin